MRRLVPRSTWLRGLLVALVAVAALAGAAAGLAYWEARSLVGELQAGDKHEVVQAARRELERVPRQPARKQAAPEPEAQTILVIGSDRRWGQEADVNSDTIVLVRLQPDRERVAVLSVPRDLLVEIPGHGTNRVNSAYALGGPALVIATLREALGVRIDHFVEVNFGGFTRLVAELGGVYLPVDQRYFNENLGTEATNFAEIDLEPGYQKLTGREALAFVRYRHTDSDLVRAARQQLFLRETVRQVLATDAYDVLRVRRLLRAFAEATASDLDDLGELWRVVDVLRSTPPSRVKRVTIPAHEVVVDGAYYVEAGDDAVEGAVARWLGAPQPQGQADAQPVRAGREQPGQPEQRRRREPPPVRLAPAGEHAERLIRATGRITPCVPQGLPPGFWWPEREASRSYRLDGEPAVALYATAGSGRSVLWSWTTWNDPPVLADPTSTLEGRGRTYELYFENSRLRQIAWRDGDWRVWITNTLRNELRIRTMVALAESCR